MAEALNHALLVSAIASAAAGGVAATILTMYGQDQTSLWWTHVTTVALCAFAFLSNSAAVCSSVLTATGIAFALRHDVPEGIPARAFYTKAGTASLCTLLGVLLTAVAVLVVVADRCSRYIELVEGQVYGIYIILGTCVTGFAIYIAVFWVWIYLGSTRVNRYAAVQDRQTPLETSEEL